MILLSLQAEPCKHTESYKICVRWYSLTGPGPCTIDAFMQWYSPSRRLKNVLFKWFLEYMAFCLRYWILMMVEYDEKLEPSLRCVRWLYFEVQVSGRECVTLLAQAWLGDHHGCLCSCRARKHWQGGECRERGERTGVRVGEVGPGSCSCGHYWEGGDHGVCLPPFPHPHVCPYSDGYDLPL